ncbi:MAG: aminotransferase class I/II-fold pyridoxal phosphate-dependent enzyme [Ruminococcaceae bacterium]|nr:aminotransferase class I/II-fold pyridoxal phosphate-dependent enzyme [Oscillospiraceae bacterium]
MFDSHNALSKKARDLKPSGIRKFFDMLAGREGVISLTVGQPDFATPWHIRDAGIDSIADGHTFYTSNRGTPELRLEISKYMDRRFGLSYDPETDILVTVGASEAIDLAVRALVDEGDEVIIPVPSFVCYAPLVEMAGGKVVLVETSPADGFKLTPERLRAAITERTKLIVLPYPSNPTGVILERDELCALAKVIGETDAVVLSDEIYAELTYGKTHVSIASLPEMKDRAIVINGFSKAYAMTGWRLGFSCANETLTEAMFKIHQYAIMCAPTVSQYAATEALRNGDGDIEMMKAEYDRRRKYLTRALADIGLPCQSPEGAFYVFMKLSHYGLSSEEFCERLLEEHNVAIVPGTAFGDCGEGYARLSYAYSLDHLKEAVRRMDKFVRSL